MDALSGVHGRGLLELRGWADFGGADTKACAPPNSPPKRKKSGKSRIDEIHLYALIRIVEQVPLWGGCRKMVAPLLGIL